MRRVLADFAAPCSGGASGVVLDEILEALEVRLYLVTNQPERLDKLTRRFQIRPDVATAINTHSSGDPQVFPHLFHIYIGKTGLYAN